MISPMAAYGAGRSLGLQCSDERSDRIPTNLPRNLPPRGLTRNRRGRSRPRSSPAACPWRERRRRGRRRRPARSLAPQVGASALDALPGRGRRRGDSRGIAPASCDRKPRSDGKMERRGNGERRRMHRRADFGAATCTSVEGGRGYPPAGARTRAGGRRSCRRLRGSNVVPTCRLQRGSAQGREG
jgi:hypothetical protein